MIRLRASARKPHDRDTDKGQGSMHLNSPGAEQNDQHGGTQSQHLQMRGEERMSREEEQRRPSALGAHLHIVTQENQGEKHTNPPHTPKALNDSHQTQQSTPYTTTTNTSHHTTPHTTPHTGAGLRPTVLPVRDETSGIQSFFSICAVMSVIPLFVR